MFKQIGNIKYYKIENLLQNINIFSKLLIGNYIIWLISILILTLYTLGLIMSGLISAQSSTIVLLMQNMDITLFSAFFMVCVYMLVHITLGFLDGNKRSNYMKYYTSERKIREEIIFKIRNGKTKMRIIIELLQPLFFPMLVILIILYFRNLITLFPISFLMLIIEWCLACTLYSIRRTKKKWGIVKNLEQ